MARKGKKSMLSRLGEKRRLYTDGNIEVGSPSREVKERLKGRRKSRKSSRHSGR